MQLSNSPDKVPLPFATTGQKREIPTDPTGTPGQASLLQGFPNETFLPIQVGGIPPSGLDFNGLFYDLTAIVRWANAGGGYAYDADFATDSNVNGYPKGARIMRADGEGYWISTVENNVTDPDAGGAGWVPDFQAGAAAITMGGVNVTLTALQYGKRIIVLTGTLLANVSLIFPAIAQTWTIINATSGDYSILARTASGTGVNLDGVTEICGDGVNIYSPASDAVRPVNSIAALKNLRPSNGLAQQTLGYYSVGDGGQGLYYGRSGASAGTYVDNGGTIIVPNGGDGSAAWLLANDGIVSVKNFGAVGDGVADDTSAIERAINASERGTVFFPPGVYLVTRTLNLTVFRYEIIGARPARGMNAIAQAGANYASARIVFDPVDTSDWFISRYLAGTNDSIGPFVHKNLAFDFIGTNGIQLGNPALPVDNSGGQAYIFGALFSECGFLGEFYGWGTASDGTFVRAGRTMVQLTKAFESTIDQCSFTRGDTQVYALGCDKLTVRNVRSYACQQGISFIGVETFNVQSLIENFQTEGANFCAIQVVGQTTVFANSRIEFNTDHATGQGRLLMPQTAAVTAGNGTLTFSANMANKLFPDISVIELADSGRVMHALVKSVSGTAVEVYTDETFSPPWTAGAATVTRIHGYGIGLRGSYAQVSNISPGAEPNCPWLVWYADTELKVSGVTAPDGSFGNINGLVIGNRHGGQGDLQRRSVWDNCSPLAVADPLHPLVYAVGTQAFDSANYRAPVSGNYGDAVQSSWLLNPQNCATSIDDSSETLFERIVVDGQPWYAYAVPAGGSVQLPVIGLPRSGDRWYTLQIKVYGSTGSISVSAESVGAGVTLGDREMTGDLQIVTFAFNTPAPWYSTGSGEAVVKITAVGDGVRVICAELIDQTDIPLINYSSSAFVTAVTRRLTVTPTVATEIFRIVNVPNVDAMVARLDLSIANVGADVGYAVARRTYEIAFSANGGSPVVLGATSLTNNQYTINAGVIQVDVTAAGSVDGSDVVVEVTGTVTGAGAGSQGLAVSAEMTIIGPRNLVVTM